MTNKKKINRTGELFSVKYSKMLSFSQVAEALMGLIYNRTSGENFSSVSHTCLAWWEEEEREDSDVDFEASRHSTRVQSKSTIRSALFLAKH